MRSDLRLPEPLYEALILHLLLALGLKGGVELSRHPLGELLAQSAAVAASASYIAAPAAMRIAIPQADAGLSLSMVLGITFPFNILAGIPLYYQMASWIGAGR